MVSRLEDSSAKRLLFHPIISYNRLYIFSKVVSLTTLGSRGKGGGSTDDRGKDGELHGLV
jgi:hypothetical protein